MTLYEAQGTLFSYFLNDDVFKLSQIEKTFITFDEDIDKEIVKLALNDLVETGILSKLGGDEEAWVLIKPLQHYDQTLSLSALTAGAISHIINKYCETNGESQNYCNPVKISDVDIQFLLKILIEGNEGEETFNLNND